MTDPKPRLWFTDGRWCCGLQRGLGLYWTGATPIEAFNNRQAWLHAKDDHG